MNEFTSNLKPLMDDFLDFKHALGIKYHTGRFYLEQLDKYNACHTNEKVLTREIAEGWANQQAHRDRRLYLSDELINYFKEYDNAIKRCFPEREYFFPGGAGGICSSTAVSANFRNIWLSAGLKRDGKVKPRAYDFRHHFACANIMKWSDEGKDIHAMLPYLMRYMGHTTLDSTYYYIHLIPDFFPKYVKLAASTEDVIPEVEIYEV